MAPLPLPRARSERFTCQKRPSWLSQGISNDQQKLLVRLSSDTLLERAKLGSFSRLGPGLSITLILQKPLPPSFGIPRVLTYFSPVCRPGVGGGKAGCYRKALCVRTPSCQSHPLLGHFRTGPQVWLWMELSAHRVVGSLQGIPTGNMSEPLSLAGSGGRNKETAPSQHGGRGPDCTSLRVTDLKGRERERKTLLCPQVHTSNVQQS